MREYYLEQFEERAAISEFDSEIVRSRARRLAFLDVKEQLTVARFNNQTIETDYDKFKEAEGDMIFKTLYAWGIKIS